MALAFSAAVRPCVPNAQPRPRQIGTLSSGSRPQQHPGSWFALNHKGLFRALSLSTSLLLASRKHSRLARAAVRPLTPSSPSQFLGESQVRLCPEDVQRNNDVRSRAQVPTSSDVELFRQHKERILDKTLLYDRSPKGSVDARIVPILEELNSRSNYVTTSSCSGRVLFVSYAGEGEGAAPRGAQTHTGRWRISHDGIVDPGEYFCLESEPLKDHANDLWLQVQAMELQVACSSYETANALIASAKTVFQRAYIKSASREWKTLVYIEGNQRIEMPFALAGKQVYCGDAEDLADIVNSKLRRNWQDMERLLEAFKRDL